MKTIFLFTGAVMLFISLTSYSKATVLIQDNLVIQGVFDGHEDYGYNFIVTKDGEEHMLTFQKIDEEALKAFDLNQETFIGAKFKVTYTTKVEVKKDEDGFEDETEINTIKKLEKL